MPGIKLSEFTVVIVCSSFHKTQCFPKLFKLEVMLRGKQFRDTFDYKFSQSYSKKLIF